MIQQDERFLSLFSEISEVSVQVLCIVRQTHEAWFLFEWQENFYMRLQLYLRYNLSSEIYWHQERRVVLQGSNDC